MRLVSITACGMHITPQLYHSIFFLAHEMPAIDNNKLSGPPFLASLCSGTTPLIFFGPKDYTRILT
jgi:hypothetical protein